MGGPFGPSVSRSPEVTPQEKAGRPMGPSIPAMHRSLETLMALLFVFLLWIWLCFLVACLAFFVSGDSILYGHLALQDSTPFWHHVCCPLSLSLFCLGCSTSTLSLFSLRRWGNPNPSGGLGFPLCSLRLGCAHAPRPVHQARHLHQGQHPALFFFFFARRSHWVMVGVWFSGWGLGSVCVLVGLLVDSGRLPVVL